ncbi:MAG TPA: hypothetical protein VEJ18_22145 [Planctomycetota bacterium]|nr:hypothetical protein [Planctomycetota bacterium]
MTMLMLAACFGAVQEDRLKALQDVFDAMEKALRGGDEAAFKARWSPEGYEKNLAGKSGLAGKAVFAQGTRKKWFLKPGLAKTRTLGEGAAFIVPCEVWGWEKERAVDQVEILLVPEGGRLLVLGGGEKGAEVQALADRFLKKEPLAPPGEEK